MSAALSRAVSANAPWPRPRASTLGPLRRAVRGLAEAEGSWCPNLPALPPHGPQRPHAVLSLVRKVGRKGGAGIPPTESRKHKLSGTTDVDIRQTLGIDSS